MFRELNYNEYGSGVFSIRRWFQLNVSWLHCAYGFAVIT